MHFVKGLVNYIKYVIIISPFGNLWQNHIKQISCMAHRSPAPLGPRTSTLHVAYGSNPFVRSWSLGLLRPWAQDPCHYAWPKAYQVCNLEPYTLRFIARDLLGQHILVGNVIAQGYYISAVQYYPGEYHCQTSLLGWEPFSKPLLPLPTKHPFKSNEIVPSCTLIT